MTNVYKQKAHNSNIYRIRYYKGGANMDCIASFASQTYAIKAQKALNGASIPSRVIKLDGEKSRHGCAYGVTIPCSLLENAKDILNRSRVKVRKFYRGDTEI